MTAKQALLEFVETMTEEDAEELLARLEWESSEFDDDPTPEEEAMLAEARTAIAAGDVLSAEELFKELGI